MMELAQLWVSELYTLNFFFNFSLNYGNLWLNHSGGQSTQIKYLSKSTDTYTKILLQ